MEKDDTKEFKINLNDENPDIEFDKITCEFDEDPKPKDRSLLVVLFGFIVIGADDSAASGADLDRNRDVERARMLRIVVFDADKKIEAPHFEFQCVQNDHQLETRIAAIDDEGSLRHQ